MNRFAFMSTLATAILLLPQLCAAATPVRENPSDVRSAILTALPSGDATTARVNPTSAGAMARCDGSLGVSFLGSGAYRTAQVVCPSPRWTLYVEVAIEHMEQVLVSTRAIQMGEPIGGNDFRLVKMPANDVAGEPITASQAVGLAAAGPISVGQTITRQNVVIPLAVRNGEPVVVHMMMAGADVTMAGTALQSGGIGQSVLVNNSTSHKRVTAMIAGGDAVPPDGQPFIRGD
jgi:flagellar basal body P-ring formation protein FlgA